MTTSRMDIGGRGMPERGTVAVPVRMTGWTIFGGVMLCVIGAVNVIQGLTALQHDDFLVNQLAYDNLTFWGWAFLIWGGLQVVGGVLTLVGNVAGPSLGMTLATIGAIGWFFMIFAAPAAAIVGIGISVAIIASLASSY